MGRDEGKDGRSQRSRRTLLPARVQPEGLERRRALLRLPVKELARLARVHERTVARILSGETRHSYEFTLLKLDNVLSGEEATVLRALNAGSVEGRAAE